MQSRPPRGGRGLKSLMYVYHYIRLCRPPRGGRGLKFLRGMAEHGRDDVAPLAGGVD